MRDLFLPELEYKGIVLDGNQLSIEEIENFLFNLLNANISAFWIAIDESFDKVFGNKNPDSKSSTDDFRAIVYILRCAFAHEISKPTWNIKPKYQKIYTLAIPLEFTNGLIEQFYFDFSVLNGERVKTQDFKHLPGLIALKKLACQILMEEVNKIETPVF